MTRIVALHSRYRTKGGEDVAFETETELLSEAGHDVISLSVGSEHLEGAHPAAAAVRVVWNHQAHRQVEALIKSRNPDVVYINNFFPAFSPSIIDSCADVGVPVVLAVHNFRLACIAGTLFRDGSECTSCVGSPVPLHGITHRCYRDSRKMSMVVTAALISARRSLARNKMLVLAPVSEYVAAFLRSLGCPGHQMVVKPNTVFPVPRANLNPPGGAGARILYVGRLEYEKGVLQLVRAFERVARASDTLTLIGEGSLGGSEKLTGRQIEVMAPMEHRAVLTHLSSATACVIPSLWNEPFGRVALESLACGTPVLVTRRGGLADIPEHGKSGIIVDPGGDAELAHGLNSLLRDDYWRAGARARARERFEERFSPAAVGATLMEAVELAAGLGPVRRSAGTTS